MDVNLLGGFPGGPTASCAGEVPSNTPYSTCPCGCACQCDNPEYNVTLHEMRLREVAQLFLGSDIPIAVLDLVITNTTQYVPWGSQQNGRIYGQTFSQISLAASQSVGLSFRFEHSATGAEVSIPFEYDMCFFDLDTGIASASGDGAVLEETIHACGIASYYHHGKKPADRFGQPARMADYICGSADISVDDHMEIVPSSEGGEDCVTVRALAQGTGRDNPRSWADVLLLAGDGDGTWSVSGTCDDYNRCPDSGVSGFPRGPGMPGTIVDIVECGASEEGSLSATGVYPDGGASVERLVGQPFRYTLPKFICLSFPAGSSAFEITFSVGGNADAPAGYGRNLLFGGTGAPECALPGALSPPRPRQPPPRPGSPPLIPPGSPPLPPHLPQSPPSPPPTPLSPGRPSPSTSPPSSPPPCDCSPYYDLERGLTSSPTFLNDTGALFYTLRTSSAWPLSLPVYVPAWGCACESVEDRPIWLAALDLCFWVDSLEEEERGALFSSGQLRQAYERACSAYAPGDQVNEYYHHVRLCATPAFVRNIYFLASKQYCVPEEANSFQLYPRLARDGAMMCGTDIGPIGPTQSNEEAACPCSIFFDYDALANSSSTALDSVSTFYAVVSQPNSSWPVRRPRTHNGECACDDPDFRPVWLAPIDMCDYYDRQPAEVQALLLPPDPEAQAVYERACLGLSRLEQNRDFMHIKFCADRAFITDIFYEHDYCQRPDEMGQLIPSTAPDGLLFCQGIIPSPSPPSPLLLPPPPPPLPPAPHKPPVGLTIADDDDRGDFLLPLLLALFTSLCCCCLALAAAAARRRQKKCESVDSTTGTFATAQHVAVPPLPRKSRLLSLLRIPTSPSPDIVFVCRTPNTPSTACETCAICLDPLLEEATGNLALFTLACGHKFHAGCIIRQARSSSSDCDWAGVTVVANACPLCRAVEPPSEGSSEGLLTTSSHAWPAASSSADGNLEKPS